MLAKIHICSDSLVVKPHRLPQPKQICEGDLVRIHVLLYLHTSTDTTKTDSRLCFFPALNPQTPAASYHGDNQAATAGTDPSQLFLVNLLLLSAEWTPTFHGPKWDTGWLLMTSGNFLAAPLSSAGLQEAHQCKNLHKNIRNAALRKSYWGINNIEREDLIGRRGHLAFWLCNVVCATFLPCPFL